MSAASIDADLTVMRLPGEEGAAVLIGSRDGTHFQIGTIRMTAGATFDATGIDPRLGLELLGMALVVKAGDGDSFLKAVLPPEGMRMPIEFGLSWSPRTGVVFHGGATLEVDLPIDLDLFIIKIPVVSPLARRRVPAGKPPEVALGVGATRRGRRRSRVRGDRADGHRARRDASRPQGGNLGPVDLGHAVPAAEGHGAQRRRRAGRVAAATCCIDVDKGEYAGILHLAIADTIEITAIALLQTKMPDGSRGLLAGRDHQRRVPDDPARVRVRPHRARRHRRHQPLAQRAGAAGRLAARRGRVAAVPDRPDPARAADHRRRRRDLPADRGPVRARADGQAGLGRRASSSATLAIIIQFPALKIALLGRLQIMLPPVEEAAVLLLRLDFAGILDVPAQHVVLRRLAGRQPHRGLPAHAATSRCEPTSATSRTSPSRPAGCIPSTTRPGRFPVLRRLSLSLAESDNPRMRFEAYFALTPATLQFGGARRALLRRRRRRSSGKLEIDATAGLDALLTFPTTFVVTIDVHVLLRRNGQPFIGVELDLRIAGAKPIDIDGTRDAALPAASTRSRSTRRSAASRETPDARSRRSWRRRCRERSATSAAGRRRRPAGATGVRLREAADDDGPLRVHPLGRLAVHQTVAPLGVTLEKAGEAPIAGPRRSR